MHGRGSGRGQGGNNEIELVRLLMFTHIAHNWVLMTRPQNRKPIVIPLKSWTEVNGFSSDASSNIHKFILKLSPAS